MPTNSSSKENPTFVFKGTILEIKNATMKQIPIDKSTVIVNVDQVIEAPKSLAKFGGHRITVQLSGSQKVQPGQAFIFHTHGWIFGDSVAVRSVKQEAISLTRAHAALLSRGGDPVMHKQNRDTAKRFDSADVVVSGKVTGVRLPVETIAGGKSKAAVAAATAAKPVSEHSPHWREAVVEIDDVHKGNAKKNVVIRFPASTDVRWYKAPKFEPGQQGFFMLHKTTLAKETTAVAKGTAKAVAKGEAIEAYTALHPMDFQPYSEPGGVRKIVEDKKG